MKVIREVLVELDVHYLFSTPSKKIDPLVEQICIDSSIQLVSCTSESNAIDSCLSYHQVSGKISVVVIDAEFVPADFLYSVENAQLLEANVIFIFIGPVNKYFGRAIEESGLILEVTDVTQQLDFGIRFGPRICLVSPEKAELKPRGAAQSSVALAPITTRNNELKAEVTPKGMRLVLEVICELMDQSPNSILIPDAGSARKIVLSEFSKKSYLTTSGLTAMGWSFRALRGITLSSPDRLPIVVIGDGSMLLCASELASAVNSQTPCAVILLINGQLGNRTEDSLIGKSSKLPKIDWQMFAESLGADYALIEGMTTKNFVKGLLRKTKEERRPVVIPMNISLETEYIYTLKTGLSVLDEA